MTGTTTASTALRATLLDEFRAARRQFQKATPFPHAVFTEALCSDPASMLASFPPTEWAGWHRYNDRYQHGKLICSDISQIPGPLAQVISELSTPAALAAIEALTGIDGLIPDPYLEGGGLHCSAPGGILAPHTDFHLYPRLGLYRRVNLLLYLNPGWEQDLGGCLELYAAHAAQPARIVVPAWGTCVVFRTDDRSQHGFSVPVTGDRWRRSVALYYYTADEAEKYAGDTNTYWRSMPVDGAAARARSAAYDTLLLGSRAIAFLAHRVDPNLSRRRRERNPES